MIVDELKGSLKPDISVVHHPHFLRYDVNVLMARLDCIVPFASGNKIYKLVGNIDKALQQGKQTLLSFGGAYSNHIHALALTAERFGLDSIGIIRGHEVNNNPTLNDARIAGMQIVPVDRKVYQRRYDNDYLHEVQQRYPNALIIPEGGANKESLVGVSLIPRFIDAELAACPHTICCAAGTGATAAGIGRSLSGSQRLKVYPVIRDREIAVRIDELAGKPMTKQVSMVDASFKGYAKVDKGHIQFVLDWLTQTGILLDPIYTSKLCRKVIDELEAGRFSRGQTIVLIHSGGLQGWRGYQTRVERLMGRAVWKKIHSQL